MSSNKPKGVGIDLLPWTATDPNLGVEYVNRNGDLERRSLYGPGRLPDWAIRQFITIENFVDYDECPPGVVSYGLSSGGYDLRVGYKFKVFTNAWCEKVSPKNISEKCFITHQLTPRTHKFTPWPIGSRGGSCLDCQKKLTFETANEECPQSVLIPPNCFALAETVETLYVPRNVMCTCLGKSTYARCGINMNFTPFEPGWFGVVTVEIINATPCPVEIFAGQGIGQCLFDLMAGEPERAYGDKKNQKYQGQLGLTLPTVK